MPPESGPMALPLALLQQRMAAALLAADPARQALEETLFAGVRPGAVGLRVHRNTMLGALSHALRQSFVSVDRLVGEAFFDRMAIEYARAAPPAAPQLDVYGAEFPDFIAGFPGTERLPYLEDLARFDWQLDEVARQRGAESAAASGPPGAGLELEEAGVRLDFLPSLRLHRARYAVDRLRDAILAEDTTALEALGAAPAPQAYALWRSAAGVKVQPLSPAAAAFLAEALRGGDGASALAAVAAEVAAAGEAGEAGEPAVVDLLTREILTAGFVRIRTT